MNHLFNDMLGEATRLTRSGNLQAATDLIQRALRGESAPVPPRPRDSEVATSKVGALSR